MNDAYVLDFLGEALCGSACDMDVLMNDCDFEQVVRVAIDNGQLARVCDQAHSGPQACRPFWQRVYDAAS